MRTQHKALDLIASLFTAFDVDWDREFDDDGYTDLWGRAPLNEPLWIGDLVDAEEPCEPFSARPFVLDSKKHA